MSEIKVGDSVKVLVDLDNDGKMRNKVGSVQSIEEYATWPYRVFIPGHPNCGGAGIPFAEHEIEKVNLGSEVVWFHTPFLGNQKGLIASYDEETDVCTIKNDLGQSYYRRPIHLTFNDPNVALRYENKRLQKEVDSQRKAREEIASERAKWKNRALEAGDQDVTALKERIKQLEVSRDSARASHKYTKEVLQRSVDRRKEDQRKINKLSAEVEYAQKRACDAENAQEKEANAHTETRALVGQAARIIEDQAKRVRERVNQ